MLAPCWQNAPGESDPGYFSAWQKVSLALQRALRSWIPELSLGDMSQYEDREAMYPLLVYQASRICHGRPRTEFTYDVADEGTLPCAWRMIGAGLRETLARTQARIHELGRPELARRYAPIWHQDVLRYVQEHPKSFISLLAQESILINAIIDMGASHQVMSVKAFARAANTALRNVAGMDMRKLYLRSLSEVSRILDHV
jgi:hypothetical protein